MAEAKKHLHQLHQQAQQCLQGFGDQAAPLSWLADFIVNRKF
jgi:geranylgeranyl pyrophosphate synthase